MQPRRAVELHMLYEESARSRREASTLGIDLDRGPEDLMQMFGGRLAELVRNTAYAEPIEADASKRKCEVRLAALT